MEGPKQEQFVPKLEKITLQQIVDSLNLMPLEYSSDAESNAQQILFETRLPEILHNEKERDIDTPLLREIFPEYSLYPSESVGRNVGDTTLFTTSGIQRIESMIQGYYPLSRDPFLVFQPVLRSQFMDSSDEASSSAFINVTLAHIDAKPEAFFEACKRTLGLLAHAGFSSSELQIKFEENPAVWADRVFRNTSLTLICRGIEIGECLYLQDFPLSETEKINIIDVGIGLERLLWAQKGPENPYLSEYNSIYQSFSGLKIPHNQAFGIVDALRSMTLIALEGIEPSNKNQGYRLRQFSKRFISRSTGFKVDVNSIVTQAFKEWTRFGHLSAKDVSGVIEMIEKENSRNYNREILNNLKSNWKGVEVDINQSTKKFLEQLSHSVPQEEINRLIY